MNDEVRIMVRSAPLNKIYKCQLQECTIEALVIDIIEWEFFF